MKKRELNSDTIYIKRKKQTIFSWVIFGLVFFNLCGLSVGGFSAASYVSRIVESWAAGNENIGKIKFVSTDEDDIIGVTNMLDFSFSLPFKNGTIEKLENGNLRVSGGGDIVVYACYGSKVVAVEDGEKGRDITFDCGFGIKVKYMGLDNVGVAVGNKVKKGDVVGICNASVIEASATYQNKPYTKYKVKDGKLSLF